MTDPSGPFAFGDIVRVKESPHTVQAGIAGRDGVVYGFTTPSATGITSVGPLAEDFALNVYIEALGKDIWLDPSSIDLVSRPEEMEFSVGGKTIRVTQKDGVFREEIVEKDPWWKFW